MVKRKYADEILKLPEKGNRIQGKRVNRQRFYMRGLFIFFAVFLLAGCGKSGEGQEQQNQQDQKEQTVFKELSAGDTAPDFTAETAGGDSFTLSEQSGKVVLLNFWATWCGPCVGEMPAFEKLDKEYGEELAILAVNCEEDKETVNQFISDNGYHFPIAYDLEGKIAEQYPCDGIPYTLVIGKDGTVKNIYIGASGADEQYKEYKRAIDAAVLQK